MNICKPFGARPAISLCAGLCGRRVNGLAGPAPICQAGVNKNNRGADDAKHSLHSYQSCHAGYVKIGKTSNLENRLKSLDATNVPLPFQCVYAVQVADYHQVEKLLHDAFADTRALFARVF